MRLLKRVIVRLRRWWNPDKLAAELDEELRFHIDMEARDLMRRGLPPPEARRRAERDFGSVERFKDEAREGGALPRFDTLWMDVRHTLRQLRLNPGFAAVAVLTLAIGLGANTAIFSVVNTVLLRSLPYDHPEALVAVKEYITARGAPAPGERWGASYLNFVDWRDWPGRAEIFADMALSASRAFLLITQEEPMQVRGGLVSGNYFRMLGAQAAHGRSLQPGPADERDRAVVLSDSLWRDLYGSDRGVLGRTVRLDDEPYVIVGVMPPWFGSDAPARFWIRLTDDNHPHLQRRDSRAYEVIARLAEGATVAHAQRAMTTIHETLAETHPEANEGWSPQVVSLHDDVVGPVRPTLLLLQLAVGTLLLLACANVANLLMARATGRRQETAMRAALGAGRGRIMQQLMVESIVLALIGGAAGLLLGVWGTRAIVALTPTDIPRLDEPQSGVAMFAFSFGVALLTGVVFGGAPAVATGGGITAALRASSTTPSAPARRARRLRGALVVAEVALSLVLLVAAGLLISSLAYLWGYEPGFDAEGVLTMQIAPDHERYPQPALQDAFYRQVYARLQQIPQVDSVGGITRLPVGSGNIEGSIEGQGSPRAEPVIRANLRPVSGDYFGALRIPLRAGRGFTDVDRDAVIVNELAARELWPGEAPAEAVGRNVRFPRRDGEPVPWRPVIGVVGDTRHGGLDPDPRPEIYELHEVRSFGVNVVVMRTRGDPLDVAAAARAAVYAVDPLQPVLDMRTMEQVIADSMRRPRFYAALFTVFGALALLIAAAGVLATAAYSTSRRRREIGVRMAIGARANDVVRMIVSEGMVLIGIGIVLGLAASLALGRWISGLLYGVGATDPLTIAAAVAVLAVASLFGFWLPARRATRIDPTEALRLE